MTFGRVGWSLPVLATALLVGCSAPTEEPAADDDSWFSEIARESGLVFRHFLGSSGEYYFPETAAGGVALFDYDGDGDLDVFLPQGSMLDEGVAAAESRFPPDPESWPGDRLYRNDAGPSGPRFVDVSTAAGIEAQGYGMGAFAADYDRDGDTDLYVSRFGSNTLYRNDGEGRFTDVTEAVGADDPRWSAGASFSDYDRDGDLDLFLATYVDFTIAGARPCAGPAGQRDYCGPMTYEAMPDRLLRNDGDRFTDVTEAAGLYATFGSGLGVVSTDLDGDGLPDFFVANDQRANQLWRNRGDGSFEDIALLSGTALNEDGQAEASMGLAVGDVDQDGGRRPSDHPPGGRDQHALPESGWRQLHRRHDRARPGLAESGVHRLRHRVDRLRSRRPARSVRRQRSRQVDRLPARELGLSIPPEEPAAAQCGGRQVRRRERRGGAGARDLGGQPGPGAG